MQVIEIRGGFGADHLTVARRPEPTAEPGRVVLEMAAAALNFRDLLMVRGLYDPRQKLPLIPCSDGVGRVLEVGAGVTRFRPGDRVAPIFAQGWIAGEPTRARRRTTLGGPLDGTLAQRMSVDAEGLVEVPDHLTDEEAATLPCAAVTAWNALVSAGGIRAGDTVLLLGTGGVSIFALQFAVLLGARAIVTSSSDEKLERALALGAWRTIHYEREPDWGRKARELTGGRGVDRVVEVGGADTLARSVSAVRLGGTIALIGSLTGGEIRFDLVPVFMGQIRLQGILVGHRESFETMNRAIAAHELRPVVDRVFPMEQARAAFEHLASARHFGKVCVRTES